MMDKGQYITKSRLKTEFGLTDSLIALLGAADKTHRNPNFGVAAPMQLYARSRVEQWIQQHPDAIVRVKPRQVAATATAAKAAETKSKETEARREQVRLLAAPLIGRLRMKSAPCRNTLIEQVSAAQLVQYDSCHEVTERALCSHLRHGYTNYNRILTALEKQGVLGEVYYTLKVYLCCRVIKRYGLEIHPAVAAFTRDSLLHFQAALPHLFTLFDVTATLDEIEKAAKVTLGLEDKKSKTEHTATNMDFGIKQDAGQEAFPAEPQAALTVRPT